MAGGLLQAQSYYSTQAEVFVFGKEFGCAYFRPPGGPRN